MVRVSTTGVVVTTWGQRLLKGFMGSRLAWLERGEFLTQFFHSKALY